MPWTGTAKFYYRISFFLDLCHKMVEVFVFFALVKIKNGDSGDMVGVLSGYCESERLEGKKLCKIGFNV